MSPPAANVNERGGGGAGEEVADEDDWGAATGAPAVPVHADSTKTAAKAAHDRRRISGAA
jgi:hypothetical protein